jgi:ATP-dependent Clp protease protease subunit
MLRNEFKIQNKANSDEANLDIYGIVGDWWDDLEAKDVVNAIRGISAKTINVRIHSEGGSVFAGLAIYNALVEHPAKIVSKIDALAASIASIIAMAGEVHMPENAFMMIHNPWGLVMGESGDMRKMADVLDKLKGSLVGVYRKKTGAEKDAISDMMDAETWLTAQEAVDQKFADVISGAADGPKNMAFFNRLKDFRNVPEELLNRARNQKQAERPEKSGDQNMEITMEILEEKAPELLAELRKKAEDDAFARGKIEGAKAELERIQAVQAQSMPGHEKLVDSLAFDGKTTGPEAAVAILAAEKQIGATAVQNLALDSINPAPAVEPKQPEPNGPPKNATVEERCKWKWEHDQNGVKAEFTGDFEAFLAAETAIENGRVKVR